MKKLFVSFVLFFNFIAFVSAQPSTATTGLRVEVMVFSGRPNPVFTITDPAQIREILSLADTMPQSTDGRAAQKQGLGYRGIAVTNLSSDASKVETLKVYRSAVEIKRKPDTSAKNATATSAGDAATEARSDNGKALETRLLAMAVSRGVIEQRLLDQIKAK
jgi:hypothetical protein